MIQVKVSSDATVVQLIDFDTQAEADAWMAEMPKHPEWYPEGVYQLSSHDTTVELAAAKVQQDAHAYLTSTDWMVIRAVDNGTAVPADIKVLREAARLTINPVKS